MRTVIVQAPDGTDWRVRVVWEPRWRALARRYGGWRRKRKDREGGGDLPDLTDIGMAATTNSGGSGHPADGGHSGGGGGGGGGDGGDGFDVGDSIVVGLVVIVGLVVFGFLFWWLLLPLLLFLLDAMVVLVLMVAGVAGRVLFRRPWTVQATSAAEVPALTVGIVGWGAALRARDEMADKLRMGFPAASIVTEYPA